LISQPIAGMYNIFIGNFTSFDFHKTLYKCFLYSKYLCSLIH
jgi:hypothetical protein